MATRKPKSSTDPTPAKDTFNSSKDLTDQERKDFDYAKKRIEQMQKYRKQLHYGINLETLWADADRDYVPHRLRTRSRRVVATDEEKGWRGTLVNLGDQNWQSDISQSNPFIKMQTALAILIDQNPEGVFTATSRQYQATTELIKQLYHRSWEYAQSKQQLKLFVHNLAKYGWSAARTYPMRITRQVKVVTEFDPANPQNTKYEQKEVVEYDDIMRETLDPRNTWIDDMARPNNKFSTRDWAFRKVYTMDQAEDEFGKYPLWSKVTKGGITSETIGGPTKVSTEKTDDNLIEFYFYENRLKDIYMVIANDVPIVIAPLPISDIKGSKKLSLWQTYWNIRHALSPYGVGIYEAIRYDQAFLDRIRNMTIDQITLSIYKMFFYQSTQNLTDTGDIKIAPGVGKQVLQPKDISWLEVPGPGKDAYQLLEMFKKDVDDASGINETLMGEITGKTAFELAQAKESAIKRLKTPLDNILDSLNEEGYITVCLMQLLYSIPEVYEISDPRLIDDYLKEIQSDPDLFERTPKLDEETGEQSLDPASGQPMTNFTAKVYPEFPLNLNKDDKGNLIESKEMEFFRTKPGALEWEGIINIKSQSVLSPSKQIDKALELEMYNVLIPLLAQPPQIYSKIAKSVVKLYDKDPRDILPDMWLQDEQPQQPGAPGVPGMPPADQPGQVPGTGMNPAPATSAPTLTANPTTPQNPVGTGPSIVGQMANLGRAS